MIIAFFINLKTCIFSNCVLDCLIYNFDNRVLIMELDVIK